MKKRAKIFTIGTVLYCFFAITAFAAETPDNSGGSATAGIVEVPLPQVPYLDNVTLDERPQVTVTVKTDNTTAVGVSYYINGKKYDCEGIEKQLLEESKRAGSEGYPGISPSKLRVNLCLDRTAPVYAMQYIIHFVYGTKSGGLRLRRKSR
jgi:hypothetical protein